MTLVPHASLVLFILLWAYPRVKLSYCLSPYVIARRGIEGWDVTEENVKKVVFANNVMMIVLALHSIPFPPGREGMRVRLLFHYC